MQHEFDLLILVEGKKDKHILERKILPLLEVKKRILIKEIGGIGNFKSWKKFRRMLENAYGYSFKNTLILADEKGLEGDEEIRRSIESADFFIIIKRELETWILANYIKDAENCENPKKKLKEILKIKGRIKYCKLKDFSIEKMSKLGSFREFLRILED